MSEEAFVEQASAADDQTENPASEAENAENAEAEAAPAADGE